MESIRRERSDIDFGQERNVIYRPIGLQSRQSSDFDPKSLFNGLKTFVT